MKKLYLLFIIFFTSAICGSAQLHRSAGMSLDYGTYAENFGLGFRYQHSFGEHFRFAPNFTYYFNNNNKGGWNLNADAHYVIHMENEKMAFYPILGLNLLSIKYKSGDRDGYSKNGYGANIGGGFQYAVLEHFGVFGEMKYALVSGTDQLAFALGVGYHF